MHDPLSSLPPLSLFLIFCLSEAIVTQMGLERRSTSIGTVDVVADGSFGSAVEYFAVRLQYVRDRWFDGYQRIVDAEKQQARALREEHVDVVSEYFRDQRNAHRSMMRDFEDQCAIDKTSGGLALEEERGRRDLYELWLIDYERLLPLENRRRDERIAAQRKLLQEQTAAARRARQAYQEALTTMDDIDTCRREQTRGRQSITQQWHDAVVIGCVRHWHEGFLGRYNLAELELWLRCSIVLHEEDDRAAMLRFVYQPLTALLLDEEYERSRLDAIQQHYFHEDCVKGAFQTLQYELWWMTAKDIPRRWAGETLRE